MSLNFNLNYSNKYLGNINNKNKENIKQIQDLVSEDISDIFSPMNDNLKILELSSLNDYHTTQNSPSKVKVKKIPFYTNKDMMSANSGKKTLVLDLDETLVHSTTKKAFPNRKNIILHMKIRNINYTIYVILRPFLEVFLHEMSLCYDLYIFTASLSHYAKILIEIIDKNKVIKQVLNRENCKFIKGLYLKDLSIFKRDLKDIIIIDNNPLSYTLNKNNGIPIPSWIDDPNDKELIKLIPIMKYLSKVTDVRPVINKIINKNKNKLDLVKVNKILDYNNKTKYHLRQKLKINKDEEINLPKDNLKINQNVFKIKKELSFNNTNYKIKTIPEAKNEEIIKDKANQDIPEKKFKKLKGIFGKEKKIIIPFQINKKPGDKLKIISLNQKKTEIYNISIGNINNIQNRINIFNDSYSNQNPNQLTDSRVSHNKSNSFKKIKKNENSFSSTYKINNYFTKKIKYNLFEDINTQVNKRNKKITNKSVKYSTFVKTEKKESPKDRVKINLNKNIIFNNKNKENKGIIPGYFINDNQSTGLFKNHFYEEQKRHFLDFKLNKTLQQEKNNRIIVMKILNKPKKIDKDSNL